MKKILNRPMLAIVATVIGFSPAVAQVVAQDDRELIKLPVKQQNLLLAEMRGLLETVDDMLGALAQGDMKKVKYIADYRLGFGHARFKKMLESGIPESQVEKLRLEMLKRRKSGGGHGGGYGSGQGSGHGAGQGGRGGGFGQGVGRFMPPEVRQLGRAMHESAGKISITVSKIKGEPTAQDYKAILADLQALTSTCRACHVSYKVR